MVTELGKKYHFTVEIIKKSQADKLGRAALPKFPAMEIDDELIFEDNIITADKLEGQLIKRNAPKLKEGKG